VTLAGEIETSEGTSAIAISRDIAAGGLLVLTRIQPAVGSQVKLTVVYQGEQLKLDGTVLREEELDPELSTLWRTKLAIAVDRDDPVMAELVAALRDAG
jgi:hypothetical protein